MANLSYCYLSVFGANFKAEDFARVINMPGAVVTHKEKAYPSSPINALRAGNVSEWKTSREYYNFASSQSNPFTGYIYEERFMVSFIKRFCRLQELLCPYKNETTEIFFVAVYKGDFKEMPAGVYFGYELIEALHEIGASISTEIVFNN